MSKDLANTSSSKSKRASTYMKWLRVQAEIAERRREPRMNVLTPSERAYIDLLTKKEA